MYLSESICMICIYLTMYIPFLPISNISSHYSPKRDSIAEPSQVSLFHCCPLIIGNGWIDKLGVWMKESLGKVIIIIIISFLQSPHCKDLRERWDALKTQLILFSPVQRESSEVNNKRGAFSLARHGMDDDVMIIMDELDGIEGGGFFKVKKWSRFKYAINSAHSR